MALNRHKAVKSSTLKARNYLQPPIFPPIFPNRRKANEKRREIGRPICNRRAQPIKSLRKGVTIILPIRSLSIFYPNKALLTQTHRHTGRLTIRPRVLSRTASRSTSTSGCTMEAVQRIGGELLKRAKKSS